MAIYNKYKIRNKIFIEPDLFYSDAFKVLSASAIRTLMRCLQKRKWEKVKVHNKKQIVYTDEGFIFPYTEAAFLGIGTTQFWKNIKKLIDVGFLDLVHQGGWYNKDEKEKDYNVYKLSERWRKYNTPEFVMVEKPKVLPKNFHIRENIERKKSKVTSQKRSGQLHKNEGERIKQDNDRLQKSEVGEQVLESRQSLSAIE
jgi:hypothetical protein